MRIAYGNIVLNEGGSDVNDCEWLTTKMSGWESAPQRVSMVDYTMKDGSVPANPTYGPRPVTIEGMCKAPDEESFWIAYNRLLSETSSLTVPKALDVTEGSVVKTLYAVRANEPRLTIHPGWFDWSISLTGTDPAKYSPSRIVTIAPAGSVTITNEGNYPSERLIFQTTTDGTLKMRHNGTGVVLTSGALILASGTVVDMRARTVYEGTIDRYSKLAHGSQWWPLPKGPSTIANLGTATVKMTYRPAWV